MTKRRDSKPADPKMFVRMPYQAGQDALALLRSTYGPHAPAPIKTLMAAISAGAEHHVRLRTEWRPSRFAPLLTEASMAFDTPTTQAALKIKANAHGWAKYHGHKIATRLDSFVGRTTVYMVQRARA